MDGCDVREAVSCRVFGCFVMLNETQQDSKFNVIDLELEFSSFWLIVVYGCNVIEFPCHFFVLSLTISIFVSLK